MLAIAERTYDPRLVVFDKDGTLIAFDALWHAWFRRLLEAITRRVPLDADARAGLAATLGCDLESDIWDPSGPLTLASTGEVELLIAAQVYRYGRVSWPEALEIVADAKREASQVLAQQSLLRPIGDVKGFLSRLHRAGLLLALATTDDRAATERHLAALAVDGLFAAITCGDDGIPLKPAPDMALDLCRRLGIAPQEALMIGDTVADLLMARRAGYLAAIGVTSGAMPAELLLPVADAVIPNIHSIALVPDQREA